MYTITLFDYIKSELIKQGFNEFVDDEGQLIIFDEEHQFMTKIFKFDDDIVQIVDKLFTGMSLTTRENDHHFKQTFVSRFLMREINRQTIEAFRLQLLTTFLSHEKYINQVYQNSEKFLTGSQTTEQQNNQNNKQTSTQNNKQTNKQTSTQMNDGLTTSDNRNAYADLPQNNVQLDVDSTVMNSATNNEISRNKQTNKQETDNETDGLTEGETSGVIDSETEGFSTTENNAYQLDNLIKSQGLLKNVFNDFDRKCFLQVW